MSINIFLFFDPAKMKYFAINKADIMDNDITKQNKEKIGEK